MRFIKTPAVTNALKTGVIIFAATLVAMAIKWMGLRVENILILYALAVLTVVMQTKAFFWGCIASVLCVLTFNFFFTEPFHTFMVNDPNYFASFVIFFIFAFVVSSLTTRLQQQISLALRNEQRTSKLAKIGSGYLNVSGDENLIAYGEKSIESLIGKGCKLYLPYGVGFDLPAVRWCGENAESCGFCEQRFAKETRKYLPIKNGRQTMGVLAVEMEQNDLTTEEFIYIKTLLNQLTLALERDRLNAAEQQGRIDIEKEQLKSNLLRSISHDLRTPLTSIAGSAEFLTESFETLSPDTVKSLLTDISNDASWLGTMVENLLNMTRIQDGRLQLNRHNEVVDDILNEAANRVAKRSRGHSIKLVKPNDIMLVCVDAQLIIQVLVNLLDNAIKHSGDGSEIVLSAYCAGNSMVFEVSDNGTGIEKEMLGCIFDSFVTSSTAKGDAHRGVGLGLNIAKSVVEAHGGTISAQNNDDGGAAFRFALPLEVTTYAG